jgi:VanZ family protein
MSAPTSTTTPSRADRGAGRHATLADRTLRTVAAAWAVLVIVLSLIPDDPSADVAWDKARHGAAYAVLTGLVLLALVWRPGRRPRPRAVILRTAVVLAVAVVVLGAVIEVLQAELVDRDGSWGDVLADAIGVAVASALWAAAGLLARHRRRTRRGRAASFESRTNHPQ